MREARTHARLRHLQRHTSDESSAFNHPSRHIRFPQVKACLPYQDTSVSRFPWPFPDARTFARKQECVRPPMEYINSTDFCVGQGRT